MTIPEPTAEDLLRDLPFLRAIVQSPDDDLPRLVYADFLEESGDAARAAFIRVQCVVAEIGRILAKPFEDQRPLHLRCGVVWCPVCGDCCCPHPEDSKDDDRCPLHSVMSRHAGDSGLYALRARTEKVANDLLAAHPEWNPDASRFTVYCGNRQVVDNGPSVFFERGFVAKVRIPLAQFLGGECQLCGGVGEELDHVVHYGAGPKCKDCHGTGQSPGLGREIAAVQPVEKYVITDAVVHQSGGNAFFYLGGLGAFPREYWPMLDRLPSARAVHESLSEVCWLEANRPRIMAEILAESTPWASFLTAGDKQLILENKWNAYCRKRASARRVVSDTTA